MKGDSLSGPCDNFTGARGNDLAEEIKNHQLSFWFDLCVNGPEALVREISKTLFTNDVRSSMEA